MAIFSKSVLLVQVMSVDVASVGAAVAVQRRLTHWARLLTVVVTELLTELSAEVIYKCERRSASGQYDCFAT